MDKEVHTNGVAIVVEEGNILASYIEIPDHVVSITDRKIIIASVKIAIDDVGLKGQRWADGGKNHNHGDQKSNKQFTSIHFFSHLV